MSRGRQMVYHLDITDVGILPVQSPVGMQLGKAAGYAKGFKLKGVNDSISIGIVGDGSTAEGDTHDAMNAASVWDLPFLLMVTDNGIAISTDPSKGRGIKDFKAFMPKVLECNTLVAMVVISTIHMRHPMNVLNISKNNKSQHF